MIHLAVYFRIFYYRKNKAYDDAYNTIKYYIEKVNCEELKLLYNYNKRYIFELISYAYGTNKMNEFLDKLIGYDIEKPSWYESDSKFSITTFKKELNDIMIKFDNCVKKSK